MLCAPSLTMPSSSAQDSSRDELEVQVGVVDGVTHDVAEHARDAVLVELGRAEQRGTGDVERVARGDAGSERGGLGSKQRRAGCAVS